MISAHRVSRRYGGAVALHPTDFELSPGELVALVGPNGAGKSTLLSLLAGALEPSSGTVAREGSVAWAPQRPAVYGRLTPRENVALFARLADVAPEPVDLPDRPVADLSVGQRQQVNLVVAFLGTPSAALLDEPTASLDPDRREELWRTVEELRAGGGGVAFATPLGDEAARADRVVRLEHGRVV